MVKITKEKNFIYIETEKGIYTLDLNKGTLYRGNRRLKTTASVGKYYSTLEQNEFYNTYPETAMYIKSLLGTQYYISGVVGTICAINVIEQIMNNCGKRIGITPYDCFSITKDKSTLSAFTKWLQSPNTTTENGINEFISFLRTKEWREICKRKYNCIYDDLSRELKYYIEHTADEIPTERKDFFIWCDRVLHMFPLISTNAVRKYCDMCDVFEKPYNKVHNFLCEYYNTQIEYQAKQDELTNEKIKANQLKAKEKYFFEDDEYITLFPTTIAEVNTEGDRQHNCLRSYIDDIVNNTSVIVFVRKKNDISKNFITCEIRRGRMWQFLLERNVRVYSDHPVYNFYKKYEKYVDERN